MKVQAQICTTCGAQFQTVSEKCLICEDERQYVNPYGQSWTTMEQLNLNYKNDIQLVAPGVYSITTKPNFAIGQTAYLIIRPEGNLLWDCIANIDKDTIDSINALGGLRAVAISHPHFFTTMTTWTRLFGDIPVYVNANDREWVFDAPNNVIYWDKPRLDLWDGIVLAHCGGHFSGSCVANCTGAENSLFVGDTLQVSPDLISLSFMYSYPNLIPLTKKDVLYMQDVLANLSFSKIYGAFGRSISSNAKNVVDFSFRRYLAIYQER